MKANEFASLRDCKSRLVNIALPLLLKGQLPSPNRDGTKMLRPIKFKEAAAMFKVESPCTVWKFELRLRLRFIVEFSKGKGVAFLRQNRDIQNTFGIHS